ncbi:MAG: hypothetical protein KBD78_08305, partial [Oligoflexales bacterium]|nr:hypothetical protein [Oligoflexales bacterium]
FDLYADADDSKLLYYVPRRGGIAIQAPESDNPIPRFSVFARMPSSGFYENEELAYLGGSWSTTSNLGALSLLISEAAKQGLQVVAVPVARAKTKILATGYETSDGRIDLQCTKDEFILTNSQGKTYKRVVPKCSTKSDPNSDYDIDTNVMYKFTSLPATGGLVSQDIPFQAVTTPNWSNQLRGLMTNGGQWDAILTGKIEWDLTASNLTRQARFFINWSQTFEQASAFAAYHNYACVDIEVKAFFQKLSQCKSEDQCGVRMEFMQDDGSWAAKAPNDADFINAVNKLQTELQDELFNEVQKRSESQLGKVSDRATAVFTMRANYEKIMFDRNEVRYFNYNKGPETINASTTLNISCLKGGFEDGKVSWDVGNQGCMSLLGR